MLGLLKRIFKRADKTYVSEADIFLAKLQRETPLSESQLKEIAKHARIAQLRDHAATTPEKSKLWQNF